MGMEGAIHLPSVLGHCEILHVLPHAGCREKDVENGPNLLRVSEKGWDKRSLNFKLVVLEIVVAVLGQDGAASDDLVAVGGVLRGTVGQVFFVAECGVSVRVFGDQKVLDHVDEGNSQHTPNAGQEGLHLFKSLSSRGEVKDNGDILGLLVIEGPAVFESFLLFELIEGREVSPHKRILDPTNLVSSAMLVPDPKGQEFESGHSQFHDR